MMERFKTFRNSIMLSQEILEVGYCYDSKSTGMELNDSFLFEDKSKHTQQRKAKAIKMVMKNIKIYRKLSAKIFNFAKDQFSKLQKVNV